MCARARNSRERKKSRTFKVFVGRVCVERDLFVRITAVLVGRR